MTPILAPARIPASARILAHWTPGDGRPLVVPAEADLDEAVRLEAEADALRARAAERYTVGNLSAGAERRRLRRLATDDLRHAKRLLARARGLALAPPIGTRPARQSNVLRLAA